MGSRRTARTGPVSRLASRRMMLTPVTWSPAKIARSTGAAPRHRGRSEKWAFSMGVLSRRAAGTIRPYATTTPSSAPEPGTSSIRSVTLSPVSRAACLTGLGASPAPLPRRLSGWLTTTTTSCLASISARSAGTAASGEPRNASRAMSENYRWAREPRSRRALRALGSPEALRARGSSRLGGRHPGSQTAIAFERQRNRARAQHPERFLTLVRVKPVNDEHAV